MAAINPEKISTKEMALILGVDVRTVSRLFKENVFTQTARGKYNIANTVQAYLKYTSSGKVQSEHAAAKGLWEKVRARKLEIEVEKLEGSVLPKADVVLALGMYTTEIATQMDAQAGRIAELVAGEKNPGKCRQIILTENRRTRASAADKLQSLGSVPPSRKPAKTTARKKPGSVGKSKSNTTKRKRRTRAVQK